MRRIAIAAVTFLGGLYYVLNFILPNKIGEFEFGVYDQQIGTGVQVVGVMAIGLGIANILGSHGGRLIRLQKGALYSASLLLGLAVMFVVEGYDFINSERSYQAWKPFSDLVVYVDSIQGKIELSKSAKTTAEELQRLCPKPLSFYCEGSFSAADGISSFSNPKAELALVDPELDRLVKIVRGGGSFFQQDVNSPSRNLLARDFFEAAAKVQNREHNDSIEVELSTLEGGLAVLKVKAKAIADDVYSQHVIKKASRLLYDGFFEPLSSAMFALLGFYIANAAYRSFRLRSVEAAVMMCAAVIIILGQTPIGPMMIPSLPVIRVWVLETLNTAGGRALFFGTAIASLALAVRMWLSLDKSPFADEGN